MGREPIHRRSHEVTRHKRLHMQSTDTGAAPNCHFCGTGKEQGIGQKS